MAFYIIKFISKPVGFEINLSFKLVETNMESGGNCNKVIEDVRLYGFKFRPDLVSEKEIDLNRKTEFGLLPLGNDEIEVLGDNWMTPQIPLNISPINLRI